MMKSGSVRLASGKEEPTYDTWWDQAHIKTLGMEGCIPIHLIRCLRKYDRGQIGWDRFAAHRIHCFNITNPHRAASSGQRLCLVTAVIYLTLCLGHFSSARPRTCNFSRPTGR